MKKKVFNIWLLAALLCGMSLGVTSCKDDDKDGLTPEEQERQALEQQEQEMTAFNVLDNLADLSNAPADYLTGTYEPTIGVADGGDAGTRIVNTNDMETAAMRFADLVDSSIDENTQSYTWTDDNVGTMTYTKTSGSQSWATVDVNIRQIPHLQKIIYRSPSQGGNNGGFDGTAYYRFGDVVSKKNADGDYEYWICVRPCFGPEGKETSHWVTIDALPKKNVWTYTGSNKIDYALPTRIGDNHVHSQNFAEMLFAIFFPSEWANNITNNPRISVLNKGVPMFNDFDKNNIRYHRSFFWERVQKAWTDPNALVNAYGNPSGISLLKTIFGTDGTPEYFRTMLKSADGLNLLTNGYSWWTSSSNSPTLYRYRFVNGEGAESNMHKEPIKGGILKNYHSVSAEVIKANISLNCKKDYNSLNPGWSVKSFFGTDNKHYIIRHATGNELATDGKEKAKEPLIGVDEVYRYNKYYGITDLDSDPEIFDEQGNSSASTDSGFKNRAYYAQGDIVKDAEGNRWVCVQPSAHGDNELFKEQPYSYFISFEEDAVSSLLLNIPRSKELTAQVLFCLEQLFHNYTLYYDNPATDANEIVKNMRDNLDVNLAELLANRDTLHIYSNTDKAESVPCSFGSALYRDANGDLCVLRLVGDYTIEQGNGGRDWSWYFYANYNNSNSVMKLNDLLDNSIIAANNRDKWVSLPWYNILTQERITANTGPRTTTENVQNLSRFIYENGRSVLEGTAPANMYREPIIAFAVKRVRDTGAKATEFEDKVAFTEYKMMKDMDEDFLEDDYNCTSRMSTVYNTVNSDRIFLEGKNWKFGMANAITE